MTNLMKQILSTKYEILNNSKNQDHNNRNTEKLSSRGASAPWRSRHKANVGTRRRLPRGVYPERRCFGRLALKTARTRAQILRQAQNERNERLAMTNEDALVALLSKQQERGLRFFDKLRMSGTKGSQ